MDESEDDINEIARQIDRHLRSHPDAADSAEGILRWWLARQHFEESVQKLEQALALLLREGAVRQQVSSDGQVRYVGARPPANDMH